MITRYDLQYGEIEEYEFGTYVTYDEYQNLEYELRDLQRKHQAKLEALNQIMWEG